MHRRTLFAATVVFAGAAAPASAHHGWGSYDAANPRTLTGTVRSITFDNPHTAILLEAEGKTWDVVLAPPFRMVNRGIQPTQLQPGDTVTVMGYPHRERSVELRAEWIRAGETLTQLR